MPGYAPRNRALARFLVATMLLRLAGIHVGREHGRKIARSLLESSAAMLEQHGADRRSA